MGAHLQQLRTLERKSKHYQHHVYHLVHVASSALPSAFAFGVCPVQRAKYKEYSKLLRSLSMIEFCCVLMSHMTSGEWLDLALTEGTSWSDYLVTRRISEFNRQFKIWRDKTKWRPDLRNVGILLHSWNREVNVVDVSSGVSRRLQVYDTLQHLCNIQGMMYRWKEGHEESTVKVFA